MNQDMLLARELRWVAQRLDSRTTASVNDRIRITYEEALTVPDHLLKLADMLEDRTQQELDEAIEKIRTELNAAEDWDRFIKEVTDA